MLTWIFSSRISFGSHRSNPNGKSCIDELHKYRFREKMNKVGITIALDFRNHSSFFGILIQVKISSYQWTSNRFIRSWTIIMMCLDAVLKSSTNLFIVHHQRINGNDSNAKKKRKYPIFSVFFVYPKKNRPFHWTIVGLYFGIWSNVLNLMKITTFNDQMYWKMCWIVIILSFIW